MSFRTDTLESMCELIVDCPHSTPKWTDEGYIVLRNQNIRNGALDLSSPSFTNRENYESRIRRAAPKSGDIVFTREAPMGEVCIIPEGLQCCLGQRQVLLRPKSDVSGEYLFWALQSPYVQHQISWNEGTGSTVSNVRIPVLKALKIPRHYDDEIHIAKILSDTAGKIELNRQTNQTLEQIAQAIFKSWFVDFEPTRAKIIAQNMGANSATQELAAQAIICGALTLEQLADIEQNLATTLQEAINAKLSHNSPTPINAEQLATTAALFPNALMKTELGDVPEGWVLGRLGDVLTQRNERVNASSETEAIPYVPIDCISSRSLFLEDYKSGQEAKSSLIKVYENDFVFGAMRPYFHKVCIAPFEATTRTTAFVLKIKNEFDFAYAVLRLHEKDTIDYATLHSTGSTIPYAKWKDSLELMSVILPSVELRKKFNHLVRPLLKAIPPTLFQTEALKKTRDTLLPKLLSGELEVSALADNPAQTSANQRKPAQTSKAEDALNV